MEVSIEKNIFSDERDFWDWINIRRPINVWDMWNCDKNEQIETPGFTFRDNEKMSTFLIFTSCHFLHIFQENNG